MTCSSEIVKIDTDYVFSSNIRGMLTEPYSTNGLHGLYAQCITSQFECLTFPINLNSQNLQCIVMFTVSFAPTPYKCIYKINNILRKLNNKCTIKSFRGPFFSIFINQLYHQSWPITAENGSFIETYRHLTLVRELPKHKHIIHL